MSYSLDVNISHFYVANVAHFHLVMIAFNLMNLFKKLVLEQKYKKRMDKWIRQRSLLTAGKLVIVAGDLYWGLRKIRLARKSIMRRIEGSRDWLGLHKRVKKEKGCKRNRGAKAFSDKVCSVDRKNIGIVLVQARGEGKKPFFLWKWAVRETILLDRGFLLVRK